MKKIFIMLMAAGVMTGCHVAEDDLGAKPTEATNALSGLHDGNGLLSVNIGGWESEMMVTRATATEASVCYISFKVFKGSIGTSSWGDAVKSITQETGDTDFGTMNCELAAGNYTLVATANQGSGTGSVDISSPEKATAPQNLWQKTWSMVKEVTIVSGQQNQLSMELPMVSSQLQIMNTGIKDDEASYVRITIGDASKTAFGNVIFNPGTGYALGESDGGADKYTNNADTAPDKDGTCTFDLPLWKTTANTDATDANKVLLPVIIKVYNASNNVLYSHTITNVPFKLGYTTVLTGNLYETEQTKGSLNGSFTFTTIKSDDENLSGSF